MVGIFVAENVTIDAGGGINADGGGYIPVTGNGNGPGAGRNTGSGGGYGGLGGGTAGGYVYGTNVMPFAAGSPGGVFTVYNSGKGGGAIHLIGRKNVTVDGTLSANAYPGAYYGGNGGSGGSVFLCGKRVFGTGLLRANGGPKGSQSAAGDGGGGRVAVWHDFHVPVWTDERIAARNESGLIYSATIPTFSGTLVADRGGTNAVVGTTGFWQGEGSPPGAIMLIIR